MVARAGVTGPLGGRLRTWCRRSPAIAGALAGLPGGVAFVLLSTTLTVTAVQDGGVLLAAAGPRWLVRLALGVLLGAAFGHLVGVRLAGALRVAVLGAAFGMVWWALEAFVLAPFRPEICALVGEVGRGDVETSVAGLACYLAYGVVTGATLWGCHALAAHALPAGARAARRLEVYVASHCLGCAEARRLAAAAAQRFPGLDVRTIDIEAAADAGTSPALPESVVAVPTYLLDGAVIARGNPDPEQLFACIASPPHPRSPHRA
ncbi:MAG: hypothetical protein HY332_24545 [Chloroflexi bacterium]|nr:hypothetical protein [Chloroflexota bacterium]